MSVLVFGAGHVASALMTILAELPCQVDWVDSRPEMFERYLNNKPNTDKADQTDCNRHTSISHNDAEA
ncbi:XdhC family protein, partial [Pseudoalteromonas sp. SIMBA_148]